MCRCGWAKGRSLWKVASGCLRSRFRTNSPLLGGVIGRLRTRLRDSDGSLGRLGGGPISRAAGSRLRAGPAAAAWLRRFRGSLFDDFRRLAVGIIGRLGWPPLPPLRRPPNDPARAACRRCSAATLSASVALTSAWLHDVVDLFGREAAHLHQRVGLDHREIVVGEEPLADQPLGQFRLDALRATR